jgi:hypothetical protein
MAAMGWSFEREKAIPTIETPTLIAVDGIIFLGPPITYQLVILWWDLSRFGHLQPLETEQTPNSIPACDPPDLHQLELSWCHPRFNQQPEYLKF